MSVSCELLDALKSSLGGISDYRAAQVLGVKQPTMSQYRNDRCPLSAEKVIQICKLADLDPEFWILQLYIERAERAQNRDEASILKTLQSRTAA